MTDIVEFSVKLRCFVRKEKKTRWMSYCPSLQVYSQGRTMEAAKLSLREALELWMESCIERDTLHEALVELGFHPAPWGELVPAESETIVVAHAQEDDSILGDSFETIVTIPAYIANLMVSRSQSPIDAS